MMVRPETLTAIYCYHASAALQLRTVSAKKELFFNNLNYTVKTNQTYKEFKDKTCFNKPSRGQLTTQLYHFLFYLIVDFIY